MSRPAVAAQVNQALISALTGQQAVFMARGTELIRQRMGITLRPLDMKNFHGEVERIKELARTPA